MQKKYKTSQLPPGRFQYGAPWRGRYLLLGAILLLTYLMFLPSQMSAQRMWINEFHYDNTGGDVGEFIEIVVEDGAVLAGIQVQLYNGDNGNPYGSIQDITAGELEAGASSGCFTFYRSFVSGIQNGSPDGIALIYQGVVIEFISYEGSFVAASGAAAGYESTDVGVFEDGTQAAGFSIQRTGTGTKASDFSWAGPSDDSPNAINTGQDFSDPTISATMTDTPTAPATEPLGAGDEIKYTVTIQNTGSGDAKNGSLDRMPPVDANTTLVPGSFQSTPLAYDVYVHHAQEDQPIVITLVGLDLDGDLFTYALTTPPSNGSLGAVSPAVPTTLNATVTYTPNGDFFGTDQFTYTVTDDDGGVCPATVFIQVQPVNDPPSITCGVDQTIDNDQGAQSVASFATGISVGPPNESFQTASISTSNDNNTIFSVQPSIDAAGTLTYTPAAGQSGTATVTVVISDGVSADNQTCTFDITVNSTGSVPVAAADAFSVAQCAGNISGNVFVDNGSGADDLGAPAATVSHFGGGTLGGAVTDNVAGASVAFAGGTLSIAANGAITASPGDFGVFTVQYRLTNATGTSDGTVTITVGPQKVFIVDNTAGAGGNGTLATPFQTLAEAEAAANASGDIIYVRTGSGSYDGGITLDNGQILLGEGVALECPSGNVVIPAGTRPTITNTGGDGVVLANDNTIKGLNISSTSGRGIFGFNTSGLVVDQVNITGAGSIGLRLRGGTVGTVDLDNMNITASTADNILLGGNTGSLTLTMDDCNITNANGTRGIQMVFSGTVAATVDMDQCTITDNATGFALQTELDVQVSGSAQVTQFDLTNSAIETAVVGGGGSFSNAINILVDGASALLNFNIVDNTSIVAEGGSPILARADNGATMQARINGNTGVTTPLGFSSAIQVQSDNASDVKVEINDNDIVYDGFIPSAITVDTEGAGSTTMHATINGNTISTASLPAFPTVFTGIEILSRNSHTLCANVNNNSVTGVLTGNLTHEFTVTESAGGSINLQGFSVNAAGTWAGNGNTQTNSISETGAAGGGTCTAPSHPTP